MNKMDISALPDELLELIFSHLRLAERNNARLVCRHWLEVSYYPSVIKNYKIKLSYYSDLNKLNLNGRYCHITIKDWEYQKYGNKDRTCAEFWSICGPYVKELSMKMPLFSQYNVTETKQPKELVSYLNVVFANTPNLKKMIVCDHDHPVSLFNKKEPCSTDKKLLSLQIS